MAADPCAKADKGLAPASAEPAAAAPVSQSRLEICMACSKVFTIGRILTGAAARSEAIKVVGWPLAKRGFVLFSSSSSSRAPASTVWKGALMKAKALSVIAFSAIAVGMASVAKAQDLFVDSDIVRGNQPGAPGPICVLNNQFRHLEKVVFRFRVRDQSGKLLDDKELKSLVVELPNGQKIDGYFGGHPPNAPTDFFWVGVWIIPDSYPSGTFTYRATATDMKGHTQVWEPLNRVTSFMQVLPGKIEFAKQ
jgi:hypothetical protein